VECPDIFQRKLGQEYELSGIKSYEGNDEAP